MAKKKVPKADAIASSQLLRENSCGGCGRPADPMLWEFHKPWHPACLKALHPEVSIGRSREVTAVAQSSSEDRPETFLYSGGAALPTAAPIANPLSTRAVEDSVAGWILRDLQSDAGAYPPLAMADFNSIYGSSSSNKGTRRASSQHRAGPFTSSTLESLVRRMQAMGLFRESRLKGSGNTTAKPVVAGRDLVDYLLASRQCAMRSDAVRVGSALVAFGFLGPVSGGNTSGGGSDLSGRSSAGSTFEDKEGALFVLVSMKPVHSPSHTPLLPAPLPFASTSSATTGGATDMAPFQRKTQSVDSAAVAASNSPSLRGAEQQQQQLSTNRRSGGVVDVSTVGSVAREDWPRPTMLRREQSASIGLLAASAVTRDLSSAVPSSKRASTVSSSSSSSSTASAVTAGGAESTPSLSIDTPGKRQPLSSKHPSTLIDGDTSLDDGRATEHGKRRTVAASPATSFEEASAPLHDDIHSSSGGNVTSDRTKSSNTDTRPTALSSSSVSAAAATAAPVTVEPARAPPATATAATASVHSNQTNATAALATITGVVEAQRQRSSQQRLLLPSSFEARSAVSSTRSSSVVSPAASLNSVDGPGADGDDDDGIANRAPPQLQPSSGTTAAAAAAAAAALPGAAQQRPPTKGTGDGGSGAVSYSTAGTAGAGTTSGASASQATPTETDASTPGRKTSAPLAPSGAARKSSAPTSPIGASLPWSLHAPSGLASPAPMSPVPTSPAVTARARVGRAVSTGGASETGSSVAGGNLLLNLSASVAAAATATPGAGGAPASPATASSSFAASLLTRLRGGSTTSNAAVPPHPISSSSGASPAGAPSPLLAAAAHASAVPASVGKTHRGDEEGRSSSGSFSGGSSSSSNQKQSAPPSSTAPLPSNTAAITPTAAPAASPVTGTSLESRLWHEGWLVKQGHAFRNWRKRWFVLKGFELAYYKTQPPPPSSSSSSSGGGGGAPPPQRVIDIREYVVAKQTLPRTPPLISLVPRTPGSGGVSFLMHAGPSAGTDVYGEWIRALEEAQRAWGVAVDG